MHVAQRPTNQPLKIHPSTHFTFPASRKINAGHTRRYSAVPNSLRGETVSVVMTDSGSMLPCNPRARVFFGLVADRRRVSRCAHLSGMLGLARRVWLA